MLQAMRENASSWIIKILLLLIVIAFVFMGLGSYRSQKASKIAVVNEQPISIDEYRETYNNLLEQVRQRFGNNLDPELLKMMNLKKQTMDRLIARTLILQEAEKLNLLVSNDELTDAIQNISVFKNNGSFSVPAYEKLLRRVGTSPEQFEEDQRKQMLTEKLRQFVTSSIMVTAAEASQWYNWENAMVNIDVAEFDPKQYKDIHPGDEEKMKYFEANKENYKTDPEIKVRYVRISPDDYIQNIEISKEEIKDYYEGNTEAFTSPKTVDARHILIKTDAEAPPELVEAARKKAIDILEMARNGKTDFSELARQYSECPSRDKGGHLGAFTKETMVKPFAEKAFSMEPGEISELVRTRFGWHIIKVDNINQARTASLEESEPEIRKKLIDEQAKNLAYDEAEALFDSAVDGDDLVKEAKSKGIKILETEFFNRKTGPKTDIRDREKFISSAFSLPEKEISDILDLSDGYYILQIVNRIPEKVSEYNEVQDRVEKDLIAEQRDRKASEDAEVFLKSLKANSSLSEEGSKNNLKITSTGFFKRNDSIPEIGMEQDLSNAAFLLSKEKKWPEKVIKGKSKYYAIEFKERKKPDAVGFEKEKAGIIKRLTDQKRFKAFESWISQMKASSKITIEEGYL